MNVSELHGAIMNLQIPDDVMAELRRLDIHPSSKEEGDRLFLAYKIGHRDARHASAELAVTSAVDTTLAPGNPLRYDFKESMAVRADVLLPNPKVGYGTINWERGSAELDAEDIEFMSLQDWQHVARQWGNIYRYGTAWKSNVVRFAREHIKDNESAPIERATKKLEKVFGRMP